MTPDIFEPVKTWTEFPQEEMISFYELKFILHTH